MFTEYSDQAARVKKFPSIVSTFNDQMDGALGISGQIEADFINKSF